MTSCSTRSSSSTAVLNCSTWPTMIDDGDGAASTIACASSSVRAIGFSTRTGTPPFRRGMASSRWASVGAAMIAAAKFQRAGSSAAASAPTLAARASARRRSGSTTSATRTPGIRLATRTWLVPMTPAPKTATSSSENLQHTLDDPIDRGPVEPGVDRERQHLARRPLGFDGGLGLHPRLVPVALVVIDGTRVVHGALDPALGQPGAQHVAVDRRVVGDADGVAAEGMGAGGGLDRKADALLDGLAEAVRQQGGVRPPAVQSLGSERHLAQADGRVHLAHPQVLPDC